MRGARGAERLRRHGSADGRAADGRARLNAGAGRASLRGPSISSPATGQPSGRVQEAHAAPESAEPQRSIGFHGPRCCFCSSQNRSCSAPQADCPRARRLRRRCGERAAAAAALMRRVRCWGSRRGVGGIGGLEAAGVGGPVEGEDRAEVAGDGEGTDADVARQVKVDGLQRRARLVEGPCSHAGGTFRP